LEVLLTDAEYDEIDEFMAFGGPISQAGDSDAPAEDSATEVEY
jgi:hypothetical protein